MSRFFDLFEKYGGFKKGQLKLKKPNQLQEVLDIVRHLLADSHGTVDPEVEEKRVKLNQLKLVLEMWVVLRVSRQFYSLNQGSGLALRNIAIWMSKNCQKLFIKKKKLSYFFFKC